MTLGELLHIKLMMKLMGSFVLDSICNKTIVDLRYHLNAQELGLGRAKMGVQARIVCYCLTTGC
jgi:hypothetical protein